MKILLVTATYPPSVNGVAISVSSLFHELKKMGHDVYVLAPKNGRIEREDKHIIRYPSAHNPLVKDYPIPLLPINRKTIKLLTQTKFDIVHAHHPFYIALFADFVSSVNNIPFVFTHHTRYEEYIKSTLNFLPKVIVNRLSEYTPQRVYKNADVVVVPSRAMKQDIQKSSAKTVVKVIPTGLSKFKEIKSSKTILRNKNGIPTDKKILLCVSRLGEEKNTILLLKSLKLLPNDFFLILVGAGLMREKLEKYVRNHQMQKRVKFVGRVAHEDIPKYYTLSDIFVFPSMTETQGLILLEAAHFGLSVVAVDSEVNREWVVKGAGYISKNDADTFKKMILKADKLDANLVDKKTNKFSKKYTAEFTAERMVKLYTNAIKRGKKKKAVGYRLKEKVRKLEGYLDKFLED